MKATKEEAVTVLKFSALGSSFQEKLPEAEKLVEAYAKVAGSLGLFVDSNASVSIYTQGQYEQYGASGSPRLTVTWGLYTTMAYGEILKKVTPETVGIWYELMPNLSKATTEDKQLLDKVTRLIKQGRFDEAKNAVMVSKL